MTKCKILLINLKTLLTRDKAGKNYKLFYKRKINPQSYSYILNVYWLIYPGMLRSLRGFLMSSLFLSYLSGHSSTNSQNLAIPGVISLYLENPGISNVLFSPFRVRDSGIRVYDLYHTNQGY